MSDLTKYVRIRAERDPEFAGELESGYADFKLGAPSAPGASGRAAGDEEEDYPAPQGDRVAFDHALANVPAAPPDPWDRWDEPDPAEPGKERT